MAGAAAASDIFGQPAAVPPLSAPAKMTNHDQGSVSVSASSTAAAAASTSRASPQTDDFNNIAQIHAEADGAEVPNSDVRQDSAHQALLGGNHATGPFAQASSNSSSPFGESSTHQTHEHPLAENHGGQHAFMASQNAASGLATAGDSGSSFFAAQTGDALAAEPDSDSFFNDLSGLRHPPPHPTPSLSQPST